jgi:hypothetical protein
MTAIRSCMMVSVIAMAVGITACATEESNMPASRAAESRTPVNISDPPRTTQPPRSGQMPSTREMRGTDEMPSAGQPSVKERRRADEMPSTGQTPTVGRMAADPLQDCLSRIPKDATAGQRSIAEQTCKRDYGTVQSDTRSGSRSFASGTQGDTLKACMDLIPQDASAGQRMMAEQSCKRDEANRRGVDIVPGAR